jgi:hypothetical protein
MFFFLVLGSRIAYAQDLALDDFKRKSKENEQIEVAKPSKTGEVEVPFEERAVARKIFDLYTKTPQTLQDSLKRTSSWIKENFKIDHAKFTSYILYMGGTLRKEDIPVKHE